MFQVLWSIAALFAAALSYVLIKAQRQPLHFTAARSQRIAASPERLHGLIENLHKMNTWNPYALRETGGTARYSGPDAGPGAEFQFSGPKSGTGSVSVIESTPSRVVMRLMMSRPIAADNRIEFKLEPDGDATRVTWAMSGASSLMGRIFNVFVDCDRMIAKDFDEGLGNLKTIAERG